LDPSTHGSVSPAKRQDFALCPKKQDSCVFGRFRSASPSMDVATTMVFRAGGDCRNFLDQWNPGETFLPQVWEKGKYTLFWSNPGEDLSAEEIDYRIRNYLTVLKSPGLYEVGGLGACTLIRCSAIYKGVCFKSIPNLELTGEDRHFCIRATVLGLKLYVDTQLPAYHIYRPADLEGVGIYKEKCRRSVKASSILGRGPQTMAPQKSLTEKRRVKKSQNRLTLVMLVKSQADRYLEEMLKHICGFIDAAVIVDDASTDKTPEICTKILAQAGKPLLLQRNPESGFQKEIVLRKQAWDLAVTTGPDWLLFLDAEQIFEKKAAKEIPPLLADPRWDFYSFRLYDFWDNQHYREDPYWQAHLHYQPFLIRYQPEYEYEWNEQPLHCGSFPKNITAFPGTISPLRVKYYGWADEVARRHKYEFYMTRDPKGKWGMLEQYRSILDVNPHLVKWEE
jgi:hypothetical protein